MKVMDYRAAVPADIPFIHDAWLESFKLSHAAGPIRMTRYREVYRPEIEALFLRPGFQVKVAFNVEDPTQVFGFIAFEESVSRGHVVHFVYVKNYCRRLGIATGLLRSVGLEATDPFVYTYKTPAATKLAQKWTAMRFDPLVARFPPRTS